MWSAIIRYGLQNYMDKVPPYQIKAGPSNSMFFLSHVFNACLALMSPRSPGAVKAAASPHRVSGLALTARTGA